MGDTFRGTEAWFVEFLGSVVARDLGRKLVDGFDPVEIRRQFEWVDMVPITPEIA